MIIDESGAYQVERWPRGQQNAIIVPWHMGCRTAGGEIAASFHTHPNSGPGFLQEPSATDRRAVRDDVDLKGKNYVGEWVIAAEAIYLVEPTGLVRVLGSRIDTIGD